MFYLWWFEFVWRIDFVKRFDFAERFDFVLTADKINEQNLEKDVYLSKCSVNWRSKHWLF